MHLFKEVQRRIVRTLGPNYVKQLPMVRYHGVGQQQGEVMS
jgi:hypothetical protein